MIITWRKRKEKWFLLKTTQQKKKKSPLASSLNQGFV